MKFATTLNIIFIIVSLISIIVLSILLILMYNGTIQPMASKLTFDENNITLNKKFRELRDSRNGRNSKLSLKRRSDDDDFIEAFQEQEYFENYKLRFSSIKKIFSRLSNQDSFVIVETQGLNSNPDMTILFDSFINFYDGEFYTCVPDKETSDSVADIITPKSTIVQTNPISFLDSFESKENIDLIWMNDGNITPQTRIEDAIQHLFALIPVYSKLKSGCIIATDDNNSDSSQKFGRGFIIKKFFQEYLNIEPLTDGNILTFVKP